jgi:flavin reductase (DIM6/NTAB) family NADH-FMN oxidoreductase RutF
MNMTEPNNSAAVDALKQTFRRHASGVAVITTHDTKGNPVGFTATSVTSLGATPPLVSFNVARGSSSWASLEAAEHVALHTLGTENIELATRMAADHTQRFAPDDWHFDDRGLPIIEGVSSVLILRIREIVNIEANAVLIGDVVDGFVGAEQHPLVYFQRGYRTVSDI